MGRARGQVRQGHRSSESWAITLSGAGDLGGPESCASSPCFPIHCCASPPHLPTARSPPPTTVSGLTTYLRLESCSLCVGEQPALGPVVSPRVLAE